MSESAHSPVTVTGKRAIVIGGTSGIGEAISLGFAADGADVVASSRRESAVARTATQLRELGARTLECPCDVTDRTSLEHLRDQVREKFGEVDILVASQGAISRQPLLTISEEEWDRVLDIQLNGVRRLIQTICPTMAANGSLIVISSLAARLALENLPAYSAAKGGVEALVRAGAQELAPDIRVNAIAPGFVITPQNEDVYAEGTTKRNRIEERCPLGRVGRREEIVGASIYLGSDAASYTTGEMLTVDGGFLPSAL